MSAPKHTPTPWKFSQTHAHTLTIRHADGGGEYVAEIRVGDTPELLLTDEANARFIVRAVNAHDDLLEALRDLIEWQAVEHEDGCPEDDTCSCAAAPIIAKVNAAIAKAEGKP